MLAFLLSSFNFYPIFDVAKGLSKTQKKVNGREKK